MFCTNFILQLHIFCQSHQRPAVLYPAGRWCFWVALCLFHKLLAALGAADVDLALALGDADHLVALGAAEIAVVPVPQAGEEADEALILPAARRNIPGEHPEDHSKKWHPG